MNPKTLLPPAARPVSRAPEPGEPAPALPDTAAASAPRVVAFLRHTGCPFAERTLQELRARADAEPDVSFVAVSHAPEAATDAWAEAVGGRGSVQILIDADRSLYAAWGLGRSSLAHFMGRRSLRAVGGLARRGIRNRHSDGTRWQAAGTFALDASGTVRWRHRPEHAGDLPDLADAARAAQLLPA